MNPFADQLPWIEENFYEIKPSEQVVLDLRYATDDNFIQKNVYGGFKRCFLSKPAGQKFQQAQQKLKKEHPELQFLIWDALRPQSVQKIFFEYLKGTPNEIYIAKPTPGSLHNFGMAIDLTLQKRGGELLDMGTGFDDFREIAQPGLEEKFLREGQLQKQQIENRLILRSTMESCGFRVLEHEWWHFNALPKDQVHGHYPILK